MKRKSLYNLSLILSLLVFLGIASYFIVPKFLADDVYPLKYADLIAKYSQQYNVDPALVAAVILQESRFNPKAVSPVGAQGLMQFMPSTAATMAREVGMKSYDIFDAETSIQFGAAHLRDLLNKYNGNVDQALASYNAGTGTVDNWVSLNIFDKVINSGSRSETVRYVKKVENYQTVYSTMYWKELGMQNPVQLRTTAAQNDQTKIRGFVWSQIFANFSIALTGQSK